MSDTWRLNAIVLAILIIADKKIAQAGYDKTRKGVISLVIDKTSGKYRVKYQDSLFLAYATSSNVYYEVGQLVSFLVPGNDWSREITIINGVKNYATNYAEVPEASLLYNKTGPNPLKINDKSNKRTVYGLCSYKDTEDSLVYKDESDKEEPFLIINQLIGKTYIPQGNGLVIGMDVQTSLDSSQVNGNYGLRFDLVFRNILTGSLNDELDFSQGGAAVRSYFVTDRDVIGNPYGLTKTTTVEHLLNIDDINPADFVKIKDIVAYCNDFPQGQDGKLYSNDIFFSNIHINGVKVLSEEDLNGYVVHIDYSETGQIIKKILIPLDEEELPEIVTIKLLASLKVNGKKVTSEDLLSYYWFRLNGLIFRNSDTYSSYGGDGWECLNNFANGKPVPATNTIYFTSSTERQNVPLTIPSNEYNTRVKCVIVYKYKETSGFLNVINKNIRNFYIDNNLKQSGNNTNKVDYYLDYGMLNLTCLPLGYKLEDDLSNYTFSWSVIPARGQAIQILEIDDTRYKDIKDKEDLYDKAQKLIEKVPLADQDKYKEATGYQAKVDNYEKIKNTSYVKDNVYYNFPISSIVNYSKIICSVHLVVQPKEEGEEKKKIYIGSASITLYNHTQVPNTYSLNIENSTQVFQYDGKGNSPTSPQLEKPLLIKPLSFTLIDDEGNQVSYLQIINNGYVEWIIPILNTLLISDDEKNGSPLSDALLIGTDKALAASLGYKVKIYKRPHKGTKEEEGDYTKNLASFAYKIADTYDSKKINNNIRLDVKYKDMLFTAYTDFTFPKDGDPGTNGTDYVAKLVPINDKEEVINTDRLYVDSQGNRYTDNGNQFDKLKFLLYNNSNVVDNTVNFWTCPPKTSFDSNHSDINSAKHYIDVDNTGKVTKKDLTKYEVLTDKVVDIVRAQNGTKQNIKYFALYPICFSYLNNSSYRFKVRPKTGFKNVVYALDGTSPDYDKTLPFEIVVEEYLQYKKGLDAEGKPIYGYYYIETTDGLKYQWDVVGSYLLLDSKLNENNEINIILGTLTENNKCYFKPVDKFVSTDLFSAIVVFIKKGNTPLGWLHIPIYMIINRYGHSALNDWDGTSIQMKLGGDTILAPQVGAGTKNSNNQFTGVLMGDVKTGSGNKQGLFGYHLGLRSIFLDATSGKAEFGKQGASKIILDPSLQMNGKDVAFLYSNGFNKDLYKENNGASKKDNTYGSGLMIDLTSPAIQFGSGHFYVNSSGNIHAGGGGDIAGWNVTDDRLYKNNTGMASSGWQTSNIGASLPSTTASVAFYAGTNEHKNNFYVTHDGFLFSRSGNIAGWDFNDKSLSKSDVGMNSDPNNPVYSSIAKHNSKAFFANGDKFYVTHDGYLKSTSGNIAGWTITDTELSNKDSQNNKLTLSPTAGISLINGTNSNKKFTVNAAGYLTSTSGEIGGWHIETNKLWAVGDGSVGKKSGIRLSANGSMSGGEGYNALKGTGEWSINPDGTSSFNSITVDNAYISTGYFGTKNSKVTIDNGGIHGTGFNIKPGGADFKSLTINGDGVVTSSDLNKTGITGGSGTGAYSLGSGAATFNPSGTLTGLSDSGKTNYKDFMEWTVDDLVVKGTFSVQDELGITRNTKWKNIVAVTGLKSIAIPTDTTYIYTENTKNSTTVSISLSNISFSFRDKDNTLINVTGATGKASIPANTFLTSVNLKESSTKPAVTHVTAVGGINTKDVNPVFNYQGIAFLGAKYDTTNNS